MALPTARTPRVQLVLNVENAEACHREIVKRVSDHHELVQIDDFVFKRRKSAPPPRTENQSENLPESAVPATPLFPPPPDVPESVLARFREAERLTGDSALRGADPEALASLAEAVCAAALEQGTANPLLQSAVRGVFESFLQELREALSLGRVRCACGPEEDEDGAGPAWDPAAETAARKRGLRARIEALRQEQRDWALVARSVEGERGGEGAREASGAESGHRGEGEAQHLDASTAAALRALCGSFRDAQAALVLRAQGVGVFLEDVDALAERAVDAARSLQEGFHRETFAALQGMGSPAQLIQAIARGPRVA